METLTLVIFYVIAAGALLLLRLEGLLPTVRHFFLAAALIAAAFLLRAACMNYETLDYQNFLSRWVEHFRVNGGFRALSGPVGNYNLPYLYFLAAFSYGRVFDLHLIKLLSIFFDVALAWGAMKLVSLYTPSAAKRLFVYLAVLLMPTVVLNGALWGQCDSIYAAFAVISVWLALGGRPAASMVCIALSFAFKLQAVFVMPVFFILLYTRRIRPWHLFLFPLTYLIVIAPAVMLGRPLLETVTLYISQADSVGAGLNYNSPSVFAFLKGRTNEALYGKIGLAAAFGFLLALYALMYVRRKQVTNRALLTATALIVVAVPFLLPHMHDRYFFMADIFSLVFAVVIPLYFPLPVLVSFASLLGYHAYLKAQYLMPMSYGALALVAVIGTLALDLLHCLQIAGTGPPPRSGR